MTGFGSQRNMTYLWGTTWVSHSDDMYQLPVLPFREGGDHNRHFTPLYGDVPFSPVPVRGPTCLKELKGGEDHAANHLTASADDALKTKE